MKDELWPELDTLHALWLHAGQQHTALPLIIICTLAFRSIRCEEQCRQRLQTIESITTLTDVCSYCDALELLQQALETWIEAEVKLTVLVVEQKHCCSTTHRYGQQLLISCTNQQQRLIATCLLLQHFLYEACTTQQMLLASQPLASGMALRGRAE